MKMDTHLRSTKVINNFDKHDNRTGKKSKTDNAKKGDGVVLTPKNHDVLCGQNIKRYIHHPGNIIYRDKIYGVVAEYIHSTKKHRMTITKRIIAEMRSEYNARFLILACSGSISGCTTNETRNSTTPNTKNHRNDNNNYDESDDGDDTATGNNYDDADDDSTNRDKPLIWTEIDDKLARDKTSHAIRYACKQLKKGPTPNESDRKSRTTTKPPSAAVPRRPSTSRMMDTDETNSVHSSSTASTTTVTSTTNHQSNRNFFDAINNFGGGMLPTNIQAGTLLNPITISHTQPELAPLLQGMGLTNLQQPIYLIVVIPPATGSTTGSGSIQANGSSNRFASGSTIPDVIPSFPTESSVKRRRHATNEHATYHRNSIASDSNYGSNYEATDDPANVVPRIVSDGSKCAPSSISSSFYARGGGGGSSSDSDDDGNESEMDGDNGDDNDEGNEQSDYSKSYESARKRKYVTEPTEHDVLLGRGSRINFHPGNVYFRNVIKGSLGREYHRTDTTREEKTAISVKLVQEVQKKGGKFLKFDPNAHRWFEISDQEARLKASQALREKMNYTIGSNSTPTDSNS